MEPSRRLPSSRQDEALQRLEPGVDAVTELFEPGNLLLPDAQALALVLQRHGEVGAEVEEVVLDLLEPRPEFLGQLGGRERQVFGTRRPSPRLVSPASPARV